MTEAMETSIEAIKIWNYWCSNWYNPEEWIYDIWGNGCDGKHFMEKFLGCKDMSHFYRELSSDNQHKLAEWVLKNYTYK